MALARVLLVFVVGCAGPTMASLQRTGCLGWCPVYSIVVHASGRVDYRGVAFVEHRGHVIGHLTPTQISALRRTFADYAAFAADYEAFGVSDEPTVTTSYAGKTVVHYLGDDSAPAALTKLEDEIDRIVDIEQWIGPDDRRKTYGW